MLNSVEAPIRDPIDEVIAVESAKLREKWLAFHKNSPKDERLDLQNTEPTIESVVDKVTKITNVWRETRGKGWRGRVASRLIHFGRTLDSHKTLLQVLPYGNEYVSIFTGSLSAVIQVSHPYCQAISIPGLTT